MPPRRSQCQSSENIDPQLDGVIMLSPDVVFFSDAQPRTDGRKVYHIFEHSVESDPAEQDSINRFLEQFSDLFSKVSEQSIQDIEQILSKNGISLETWFSTKPTINPKPCDDSSSLPTKPYPPGLAVRRLSAASQSGVNTQKTSLLSNTSSLNQKCHPTHTSLDSSIKQVPSKQFLSSQKWISSDQHSLHKQIQSTTQAKSAGINSQKTLSSVSNSSSLHQKCYPIHTSGDTSLQSSKQLIGSQTQASTNQHALLTQFQPSTQAESGVNNQVTSLLSNIPLHNQNCHPTQASLYSFQQPISSKQFLGSQKRKSMNQHSRHKYPSTKATCNPLLTQLLSEPNKSLLSFSQPCIEASPPPYPSSNKSLSSFSQPSFETSPPPYPSSNKLHSSFSQPAFETSPPPYCNSNKSRSLFSQPTIETSPPPYPSSNKSLASFSQPSIETSHPSYPSSNKSHSSISQSTIETSHPSYPTALQLIYSSTNEEFKLPPTNTSSPAPIPCNQPLKVITQSYTQSSQPTAELPKDSLHPTSHLTEPVHNVYSVSNQLLSPLYSNPRLKINSYSKPHLPMLQSCSNSHKPIATLFSNIHLPISSLSSEKPQHISSDSNILHKFLSNNTLLQPISSTQSKMQTLNSPLCSRSHLSLSQSDEDLLSWSQSHQSSLLFPSVHSKTSLPHFSQIDTVPTSDPIPLCIQTTSTRGVNPTLKNKHQPSSTPPQPPPQPNLPLNNKYQPTSTPAQPPPQPNLPLKNKYQPTSTPVQPPPQPNLPLNNKHQPTSTPVEPLPQPNPPFKIKYHPTSTPVQPLPQLNPPLKNKHQPTSTPAQPPPQPNPPLKNKHQPTSTPAQPPPQPQLILSPKKGVPTVSRVNSDVKKHVIDSHEILNALMMKKENVVQFPFEDELQRILTRHHVTHEKKDLDVFSGSQSRVKVEEEGFKYQSNTEDELKPFTQKDSYFSTETTSSQIEESHTSNKGGECVPAKQIPYYNLDASFQHMKEEEKHSISTLSMGKLEYEPMTYVRKGIENSFSYDSQLKEETKQPLCLVMPKNKLGKTTSQTQRKVVTEFEIKDDYGQCSSVCKGITKVWEDGAAGQVDLKPNHFNIKSQEAKVEMPIQFEQQNPSRTFIPVCENEIKFAEENKFQSFNTKNYRELEYCNNELYQNPYDSSNKNVAPNQELHNKQENKFQSSFNTKNYKEYEFSNNESYSENPYDSSKHNVLPHQDLHKPNQKRGQLANQWREAQHSSRLKQPSNNESYCENPYDSRNKNLLPHRELHKSNQKKGQLANQWREAEHSSMLKQLSNKESYHENPYDSHNKNLLPHQGLHEPNQKKGQFANQWREAQHSSRLKQPSNQMKEEECANHLREQLETHLQQLTNQLKEKLSNNLKQAHDSKESQALFGGCEDVYSSSYKHGNTQSSVCNDVQSVCSYNQDNLMNLSKQADNRVQLPIYTEDQNAFKPQPEVTNHKRILSFAHNNNPYKSEHLYESTKDSMQALVRNDENKMKCQPNNIIQSLVHSDDQHEFKHSDHNSSKTFFQSDSQHGYKPMIDNNALLDNNTLLDNNAQALAHFDNQVNFKPQPIQTEGNNTRVSLYNSESYPSSKWSDKNNSHLLIHLDDQYDSESLPKQTDHSVQSLGHIYDQEGFEPISKTTDKIVIQSLVHKDNQDHPQLLPEQTVGNRIQSLVQSVGQDDSKFYSKETGDNIQAFVQSVDQGDSKLYYKQTGDNNIQALVHSVDQSDSKLYPKQTGVDSIQALLHCVDQDDSKLYPKQTGGDNVQALGQSVDQDHSKLYSKQTGGDSIQALLHCVGQDDSKLYSKQTGGDNIQVFVQSVDQGDSKLYSKQTDDNNIQAFVQSVDQGDFKLYSKQTGGDSIQALLHCVDQDDSKLYSKQTGGDNVQALGQSVDEGDSKLYSKRTDDNKIQALVQYVGQDDSKLYPKQTGDNSIQAFVHSVDVDKSKIPSEQTDDQNNQYLANVDDQDKFKPFPKQIYDSSIQALVHSNTEDKSETLTRQIDDGTTPSLVHCNDHYEYESSSKQTHDHSIQLLSPSGNHAEFEPLSQTYDTRSQSSAEGQCPNINIPEQATGSNVDVQTILSSQVHDIEPPPYHIHEKSIQSFLHDNQDEFEASSVHIHDKNDLTTNDAQGSSVLEVDEDESKLLPVRTDNNPPGSLVLVEDDVKPCPESVNDNITDQLVQDNNEDKFKPLPETSDNQKDPVHVRTDDNCPGSLVYVEDNVKPCLESADDNITNQLVQDNNEDKFKTLPETSDNQNSPSGNIESDHPGFISEQSYPSGFAENHDDSQSLVEQIDDNRNAEVYDKTDSVDVDSTMSQQTVDCTSIIYIKTDCDALEPSMQETENKESLEPSLQETENKESLERSMQETENKESLEPSLQETENKESLERSMQETEIKESLEPSSQETENKEPEFCKLQSSELTLLEPSPLREDNCESMTGSDDLQRGGSEDIDSNLQLNFAAQSKLSPSEEEKVLHFKENLELSSDESPILEEGENEVKDDLDKLHILLNTSSSEVFEEDTKPSLNSDGDTPIDEDTTVSEAKEGFEQETSQPPVERKSFSCSKCWFSSNIRWYVEEHELSHYSRSSRLHRNQFRKMSHNATDTSQGMKLKESKPSHENIKEIKLEDSEITASSQTLVKSELSLEDNSTLESKDENPNLELVKHETDQFNEESVDTIEGISDSAEQNSPSNSPVSSYEKKKSLKNNREHLYECMQCDYKGRSLSYLKRHEMYHLEERRYKCTKCSFSANFPSYLREHEKIHSEDRPFTCPKCNFASKGKSNLMKHIIKCRGVRKPKLLKSELTHSEASRLKKNKRKCTKKSLRKDAVKSKLTHTKTIQLRDHKGRFNGRSYLAKVDGKCSDVRQFICPKCSYGSKFKSNLKNHMRKCNSSGEPNREDTSHQVTKTSSRNLKNSSKATELYKCSKCSFDTSNSDLLLEHKQIHEKPFKCAHCDFICKFKSTLTKHERKHSKTKSSLSSVLPTLKIGTDCNFTSNYQPYLEKPKKKKFKMNLSYDTHQKPVLDNHEKAHVKITIFNCKSCDFAAKQKCELKEHEKMCHPPALEVNPKEEKNSVKPNINDLKNTEEGSAYPENEELHHPPPSKKEMMSSELNKCNNEDKATVEESGKIPKVPQRGSLNCPFCSFVTSNRRLLTQHKFTHERNTFFNCPKCEFTTSTRRRLRNHSEVHLETSLMLAGSEQSIKENLSNVSFSENNDNDTVSKADSVPLESENTIGLGATLCHNSFGILAKENVGDGCSESGTELDQTYPNSCSNPVSPKEVNHQCKEREMAVEIGSDSCSTVKVHLEHVAVSQSSEVTMTSTLNTDHLDSVTPGNKDSNFIESEVKPHEYTPTQSLSRNNKVKLTEEESKPSQNIQNKLLDTKMKGRKKRLKCHSCKFSTVHRNILRKHESLHPTITKLKCQMCEFTTNNNQSLSRHTQIHSNKHVCGESVKKPVKERKRRATRSSINDSSITKSVALQERVEPDLLNNVSDTLEQTLDENGPKTLKNVRPKMKNLRVKGKPLLLRSPIKLRKSNNKESKAELSSYEHLKNPMATVSTSHESALRNENVDSLILVDSLQTSSHSNESKTCSIKYPKTESLCRDQKGISADSLGKRKKKHVRSSSFSNVQDTEMSLNTLNETTTPDRSGGSLSLQDSDALNSALIKVNSKIAEETEIITTDLFTRNTKRKKTMVDEDKRVINAGKKKRKKTTGVSTKRKRNKANLIKMNKRNLVTKTDIMECDESREGNRNTSSCAEVIPSKEVGLINSDSIVSIEENSSNSNHSMDPVVDILSSDHEGKIETDARFDFNSNHQVNSDVLQVNLTNSTEKLSDEVNGDTDCNSNIDLTKTGVAVHFISSVDQTDTTLSEINGTDFDTKISECRIKPNNFTNDTDGSLPLSCLGDQSVYSAEQNHEENKSHTEAAGHQGSVTSRIEVLEENVDNVDTKDWSLREENHTRQLPHVTLTQEDVSPRPDSVAHQEDEPLVENSESAKDVTVTEKDVSPRADSVVHQEGEPPLENSESPKDVTVVPDEKTLIQLQSSVDKCLDPPLNKDEEETLSLLDSQIPSKEVQKTSKKDTENVQNISRKDTETVQTTLKEDLSDNQTVSQKVSEDVQKAFMDEPKGIHGTSKQESDDVLMISKKDFKGVQRAVDEAVSVTDNVEVVNSKLMSSDLASLKEEQFASSSEKHVVDSLNPLVVKEEITNSSENNVLDTLNPLVMKEEITNSSEKHSVDSLNPLVVKEEKFVKRSEKHVLDSLNPLVIKKENFAGSSENHVVDTLNPLALKEEKFASSSEKHVIDTLNPLVMKEENFTSSSEKHVADSFNPLVVKKEKFVNRSEKHVVDTSNPLVVKEEHSVGTKDFAYKCLKCSYSAKRRSTLKKHELTHCNKEWNMFACDQCNYTTHTPRNLKRHKKKHLQTITVNKSMKCDGNTFTDDSQNIQNEQEASHSISTVEDNRTKVMSKFLDKNVSQDKAMDNKLEVSSDSQNNNLHMKHNANDPISNSSIHTSLYIDSSVNIETKMQRNGSHTPNKASDSQETRVKETSSENGKDSQNQTQTKRKLSHRDLSPSKKIKSLRNDKGKERKNCPSDLSIPTLVNAKETSLTKTNVKSKKMNPRTKKRMTRSFNVLSEVKKHSEADGTMLVIPSGVENVKSNQPLAQTKNSQVVLDDCEGNHHTDNAVNQHDANGLQNILKNETIEECDIQKSIESGTVGKDCNCSLAEQDEKNSNDQSSLTGIHNVSHSDKEIEKGTNSITENNNTKLELSPNTSDMGETVSKLNTVLEPDKEPQTSRHRKKRNCKSYAPTLAQCLESPSTTNLKSPSKTTLRSSGNCSKSKRKSKELARKRPSSNVQAGENGIKDTNGLVDNSVKETKDQPLISSVDEHKTTSSNCNKKVKTVRNETKTKTIQKKKQRQSKKKKNAPKNRLSIKKNGKIIKKISKSSKMPKLSTVKSKAKKSVVHITSQRPSGSHRMKCSTCGFKTKTTESLNRHLVTHKDKLLKCSQCNYSTSVKRNLVRHEFSHLKVKRLKCSNCPFRTNFHHHLKTHQTKKCPVLS